MLLLCACKDSKNLNSSLENQSSFITGEKMQELMKENDYIILDVRTEDEYNNSHVKGAINIPHNLIDENIALDKTKIIFVYCLSGRRSSLAHNTLEALGYTVYNLGAFENIDLPKD